MENYTRFCIKCNAILMNSEKTTCSRCKLEKENLEKKRFIPPLGCNCGFEYGSHRGWCNYINTK